VIQSQVPPLSKALLHSSPRLVHYTYASVMNTPLITGHPSFATPMPYTCEYPELSIALNHPKAPVCASALRMKPQYPPPIGIVWPMKTKSAQHHLCVICTYVLFGACVRACVRASVDKADKGVCKCA
jgi:hypothetical protein